MKKKLKKLLAGVLAAAMCAGMTGIIPGTEAQAFSSESYSDAGAAEEIASGSCGPGTVWSLDAEGTMTIGGSGTVEDFENHYADAVTRLVIESGVDSIDTEVFAGYGNLEEAVILSQDVQIRKGAFGSGTVIWGKKGTAPQNFARNNGNPFAALMSYPDVPEGIWFYNEVKYGYDNGIMTGTSDGNFGPYNALPRCQFAVILHRLAGGETVPFEQRYPDVADGMWYTDAIMWASEAGIISGYSNGYFGVADNITREEMATMMYRYARYKGYDTGARADFDQFLDGNKVNDFARKPMSWAVGCGLISGKYGQTVLDPQGQASRAETAIIIMRFMENIRPAAEVSSVSLDRDRIEMEAYDSIQLKAEVAAEEDVEVLWRSGDNSVATVVNGKVEGVSAGYTVIVAKAGDRQALCRVRVTKVDVTELRLSSSELVMNSGEGTQLNVFLTPSNASASAEDVVWSSSDGNVASVSNGFIVAGNPGQAVITATVDSVSASCIVNVYSRGAINYLLSYISNYGYINENGNREIEWESYDAYHDITYVSLVEYWPDWNELTVYTMMDGAVIGYFDYSISDAKADEYYIEGVFSDAYFYAGTTFNSYNLMPDDELGFMTYEISGAATYEQVNRIGTNLLHVSVRMLETQLRNTLGIGVKDLGFASYDLMWAF